MKLIIAGSRDLDFRNEELDDIMSAVGLPVHLITEVVSGGARGIDLLGEYWAECRPDPLKVTIFEAQWGSQGKAAGPIRNAKMAQYADAALIIMKKGGSRGSQSMINEMKKLNKTVYVFEMEK